MMFSSIDQAFDFYCEYAKKAGFGACKGGSYMHGVVLQTKYFTCCKEGHKPAKMYDSKGDCNESSKPYYKRRKRPTIRCGCRAHIQLKSVDGEFFQVDDFVEGHSHKMVADSDMQFVRSARKLTHVQEEAIYKLSNMNLGPADETSKSNHIAFGHIISFDATFKTNKYKMVFVPFTAIDNHCHSVTVGAGLLASETIESYTCLLQMFLKSFGHAPNTRHRLCMWHIMKKVADKVGADLCNNEDFKSRLCNIVWTDSISPSEFEEKWQAIMVDFEFDMNKWLTDMY
ncbi:protein FAR1-RELATED SEQUENCE 5-like [Bidens hawaiensis]|uniref:protein FAR1-RELATED SEQUENCE 5-like n=1 Tax=Bidens hawaiensis TaxID=980011 RepID=UPI00404A6481